MHCDKPIERIWAALKNYAANTAVTWPGRLRQIHSFFRNCSPDQMLTTEAPWKSAKGRTRTADFRSCGVQRIRSIRSALLSGADPPGASEGRPRNEACSEAYAKVSLKKYKPMAARNEDRKVSSGLL